MKMLLTKSRLMCNYAEFPYSHALSCSGSLLRDLDGVFTFQIIFIFFFNIDCKIFKLLCTFLPIKDCCKCQLSWNVVKTVSMFYVWQIHVSAHFCFSKSLPKEVQMLLKSQTCMSQWDIQMLWENSHSW